MFETKIIYRNYKFRNKMVAERFVNLKSFIAI